MSPTSPVTSSPTYDRIWITSEGLRFQFFTCPRGQRDPNGCESDGPKTLADTSQGRSGAYPEPESKTITAIRLAFDPGTAPESIRRVLRTGWLELRTLGGSIVAWRSGLGRRSRRTIRQGHLRFVLSNVADHGYGAVDIFVNENFTVDLCLSEPLAGPRVRVRCELEGPHYLVDVCDEERDEDGRGTGRIVSVRRARPGRTWGESDPRPIVSKARQVTFAETRLRRIVALAHEERDQRTKIGALALEALDGLSGEAVHDTRQAELAKYRAALEAIVEPDAITGYRLDVADARRRAAAALAGG